MAIAMMLRGAGLRARRILGLATMLAAFTVGAGRAEAKTIGEVLAEFRLAQDGLLQAYSEFQAGDAAAASLTLQQAQAILDSVKADLVDPSVADALGRKLQTALRKTGVFQERIRLAEEYVERGAAKAKVLLGKVTSAWTFGQRTANLLGKPMLALNGSSAGFYTAGKRATFRFAVQDGCTTPPVVLVENVYGARALDTANVLVDESRGLIHVPMGTEAGAGRVTVTACGVTETMLLCNKGNGLPTGFPADLQTGRYRLSYSINGGPSVFAGTVRLTNLKTFAKDIQRIVGGVVASIQLPGECTKSMAWHAATDTRFGYTFTLTCTVDGMVFSSTGTFVIERM